MIGSAHNLEGQVPDAAAAFSDAVAGPGPIDLQTSFNSLMASMDGLGVHAPGMEMNEDLTLG